MFKVNNKDTRTNFTLCSSVSIVNFERAIAGWVVNVFQKFFQNFQVAIQHNVNYGISLISTRPQINAAHLGSTMK